MEAQRSADGFSWQIKGATPQAVQTLAPRYECKWLDRSALDYDRAFGESAILRGYLTARSVAPKRTWNATVSKRLSKKVSGKPFLLQMLLL
jgi:hypothetical protein